MSWYKNRISVPGEVIFEVLTRKDGVGFGFAVADVHDSKRHFHNHTTEVYTLISGVLEVQLGDETFRLTSPGESVIINQGIRHSAKCIGDLPARISVVTIPAWTQEDHILEEKS